jgi:NADH-quinone oxidoreductase subunit L
MTKMQLLYLVVPLAPLVGAIVACLFGWAIGRAAAHRVTIACMIVSTVAAVVVYLDVLKGNTDNFSLYTWLARAMSASRSASWSTSSPRP